MDAESRFYERAEEWLLEIVKLNPVSATQLGDHRWDDRLADMSREGLGVAHEMLQAARSWLETMDVSSFGLDALIDRSLMVQLVNKLLRQAERIQSQWRDPSAYLDEALGGVFVLILTEFAPLADRLHSALGRVRQVPRVLHEAQENLVPADVPRVWVETALEQVEQAPGLFLGLLPAMAAQAAPEIQGEMAEAGQAAAEALGTFTQFLRDAVLPQAEGDFAAGRELFDEILREEHMVDYDAEELLETGWKLFHQTKAQMAAVAREIDPSKTVQELLELSKADHPTAEGLLPAYERAMVAARQFVVDHEIASIPEGESLRVVETPVYLHPLIPYAAYLPPGILEKKQEGIFVVTPVDSTAPSDVQEQRLKGHYRAKLPITALHEAYPGHHLQLVWGNRQETIPRRMGNLLATLFIEGWAFYCEELMEQLGFISLPVQRLARLSDQLWRAARIILDTSLHTRGMSVGEAVQFLVKECQLEPENALAEVRRYTSTPTQPQSYLMGKMAILNLIADYRRVYPDAPMKQIHDAVLGCGSLPPRLMRLRLLGEA